MIPVQLNFVVPPLVAAAPEITALVRTLEATWPGLTLRFHAEPGGPEGARLVPIPDPAQWIAERFDRNQRAALFAGPNQPAISVSFAPRPQRAPDGTASTRVTVWLPATLETGQLTQIVGTAGDALAAWQGWYMPAASGGLIMQILSKPPVPGPATSLLEASPELAELANLGVNQPASSARVPSTIGWLNYWSKDTAALLQFRPQDALGGAARTARDAWTWQLTAEPFDMQRPDHTAALLDAYRRLRAALNHKN